MYDLTIHDHIVLVGDNLRTFHGNTDPRKYGSIVQNVNIISSRKYVIPISFCPLFINITVKKITDDYCRMG